MYFYYDNGGLDFSKDRFWGFSSIAVCILSKYNIPLAILGGIWPGGDCGGTNGLFYVNRKIQSFIVTICTMFLLRSNKRYLTPNARCRIGGVGKIPIQSN